MSSNLMNLLSIGFAIALVILIVLLCVLVVLYMKSRPKKDKNIKQKEKKNAAGTTPNVAVTKDSIMNFMEFDKIKDNMIVQKNGL